MLILLKIFPTFDNFFMDSKQFRQLVFEALGNLPTFFRKKLDNVEVTVEDWPKDEMAKGRLLLGLYHGVPKTTWGRTLAPVIPDKITIYMGPILWLARGDAKRIKELVIDTVTHEIAHHFGISDKRLDELRRKTN